MRQNESQLSACLLHTRRHTNWDGRQIQSGTTLWDSPPREMARTVLSPPPSYLARLLRPVRKPLRADDGPAASMSGPRCSHKSQGELARNDTTQDTTLLAPSKNHLPASLFPSPSPDFFSPTLNLVCLESLLFLPSQGLYSINFPFFIYTFLDLQVFLF